MKVAIVHDWLIGGGAEKVVESLHEIYPEAPIYTSYCSEEWQQRLGGKVVTGYLQKWPFSRIRKFIPFLRALWFSKLNLSDYDLIISSSGAEAKFVHKLKVGAKHVSYVHAPTHYYWSRYDQYMQQPGFPAGFNWLARLGLKLFVGPMRRWDFKAAQRPDFLIANSTFTQSEIQKYYKRESLVIHPPVDTEKFENPKKAERSGFVIVGRQVPYKRIDLAVLACTQANLPLTVIGDGPDHDRLLSLSGLNVTFVTEASDSDVVAHFHQAEAFIFPGVDDFGIAAVEALSAGCPVIAFKDGGALDYIVEGETGLFFTDQSVESLKQVLVAFNPSDFKETACVKKAQEFSKDAFAQKIRKLTSPA